MISVQPEDCGLEGISGYDRCLDQLASAGLVLELWDASGGAATG
jgi:hypothetical protein